MCQADPCGPGSNMIILALFRHLCSLSLMVRRTGERGMRAGKACRPSGRGCVPCCLGILYEKLHRSSTGLTHHRPTVPLCGVSESVCVCVGERSLGGRRKLKAFLKEWHALEVVFEKAMYEKEIKNHGYKVCPGSGEHIFLLNFLPLLRE